MVSARLLALGMAFIAREAFAACVDATCASEAQMNGGPQLLQHAREIDKFESDLDELDSQGNPFWKKQHKGCSKMVKTCVTSDESKTWFEANWTAWKLGFELCCNLKYNPTLCGELDDALFNFTDRNFSGGRLVKETPDPQMADFCMEADGLLTTHLGHVTFEEDEVITPSSMLVQTMTSKATSGVLKKIFSKFGTTSGLTKLFARASAHSRAQRIQSRVSQCHANINCWEEVSNVRPLLMQMAERANETLHCPTESQLRKAAAQCTNWRAWGSCEATCLNGYGCCTLQNNKCVTGYTGCVRNDPPQGGDESCFPAGARVALSTSTVDIPVEQLRRGDQVWSPDFVAAGTTAGISTAEYMIDNHVFNSGYETKILDYVEISHEFMRLGRPLLMTGRHLLFVRRSIEDQEPSWQLERADAVRQGDVVLSLDAGSNRPNPSTVTRVRWVKAQGVFAPFTTSARLFVEGVAVSSIALAASWQETWDSLAPDRRTLWVERLCLLWLVPSRILNYLGMDFDWLHKPSNNDLAIRAADKILETFFL